MLYCKLLSRRGAVLFREQGQPDRVARMDTYVHDLSPYAIRIYEHWGLRWYGLSYVAGFLAQFLLIVWLSKRKLSPLKVELASDFVFSAALGCIIGGRLGYCLFYSPELFKEFSSSPPFWGVLAINKGGMASHGGILGIIFACIYYAKRHAVSAAHLFDLCTLGGSIGIFFGRIANFINGELVGRPAPEGLRWAVKFPQDMYLWGSAQLMRITEAAANMGVDADTWRGAAQRVTYDAHSRSLVESTISGIISAIQSGNTRVTEMIAPYLIARHPSQIYEALLEGLFLFFALMLIWRAPRKPGVVAGWFFTLYSCVRIFGEQFRMPDAQIGFQIFGSTRGQLLSIGLLAFGISLLVISNRRATEKIGGWGTQLNP